MGNDRPARLNDVLLKVTELGSADGGGTVHLSGLVMHSAISVQSIDVREEGDAKRVMMVIGLTQPGQSGAFDIDVAVDGQTHRIYFGTGDSAVWQREVVT